MNYNDLIKITAGTNLTGADVNDSVRKLLSPRPLENPEELEKIISARFRYTGPGKWVKILKDSEK